MFLRVLKIDQFYVLCGSPLVHHPRNNLLLQPTIYDTWDKGLLQFQVLHVLQTRLGQSLEWDGRSFDIIVRVSGLESGALITGDLYGGFKLIDDSIRIKIGSKSSDFDNIRY